MRPILIECHSGCKRSIRAKIGLGNRLSCKLEDKAVRLRGLLDKSYNKELRTFAKALAHYIFIVSARGGFNANVPGIFKFVVKQIRQDYSVPSLVQAAKETYFKKHNLEGLQ